MSNNSVDNSNIENLNLSQKLLDKIQESIEKIKSMEQDTLKTAKECYTECAELAKDEGIPINLINGLLKQRFKDIIAKTTLVDYSHSILGIPILPNRTNPSRSTITKLHNNVNTKPKESNNIVIPHQEDIIQDAVLEEEPEDLSEQEIQYQDNQEFKKFREEKGELQPREPPQSEEVEDYFIPPNRFKKVFLGMMKVRQTAEDTGVYITSNWDVIINR